MGDGPPPVGKQHLVWHTETGRDGVRRSRGLPSAPLSQLSELKGWGLGVWGHGAVLAVARIGWIGTCVGSLRAASNDSCLPSTHRGVKVDQGNYSHAAFGFLEFVITDPWIRVFVLKSNDSAVHVRVVHVRHLWPSQPRGGIHHRSCLLSNRLATFAGVGRRSRP